MSQMPTPYLCSFPVLLWDRTWANLALPDFRRFSGVSSAGGGGGERLQVVLGAFAVGAGWGPAVSELYKCRQDASALGAFILPTLGDSRDTAAE